MQLDDYVNTLGKQLKSLYGVRVRKLSIDAGFSCPNRDGTIGRGGCTFCSNDAFLETSASPDPVSYQMAIRKREMKHHRIKYLAYFQAYTNTHAELSCLQALYQEALTQPDVVGLCVGTRPDCLPDEVLALLSEFKNHGKTVWLELGLQTANDKTLRRINRGHDFACYENAAKRTQQFGLDLCCHLILGLPHETPQDFLETHDKVLNAGVQGLKLHPLHIVRNSAMARSWRAGRITPPEQDAYVESAVALIQRTPKNIVYHRVSAKARKPTLLAPDWIGNKWQPIVAITRALAATGAQGSKA